MLADSKAKKDNGSEDAVSAGNLALLMSDLELPEVREQANAMSCD